MLFVLRRVAISLLSVCCLCSGDDMQHLRFREARDVLQTIAARSYAKESIKEAELYNSWGNQNGHQKLLEHPKRMQTKAYQYYAGNYF